MSWTIIPTGGAWKRVPFLRWTTQAWLLVLILASLQPKRPPSLAALHREIHWLGFAGAAFLLLLAARNLSQAIQRAGAAFLLGLSLEWFQHLAYHRAFEWLDVSDDACAILAAFAVYWIAIRPSAPLGRRT